MAKFCPNCGKEVDEKAVVCVGCGVALNNQSAKNVDPTAKSKMAAGLLAIFLGSLGVHNFYLGNAGKAVAQLLLTLVGWIFIVGPLVSSVWALVEGIMILTGSIKTDGHGKPLAD